jgi:hypothetical protein
MTGRHGTIVISTTTRQELPRRPRRCRSARPLAKMETAVEVTFAKATKPSASTPMKMPPMGTIHSVGSSDCTTSAENRPTEQTTPLAKPS